jgi:hypothetical protein
VQVVLDLVRDIGAQTVLDRRQVWLDRGPEVHPQGLSQMPQCTGGEARVRPTFRSPTTLIICHDIHPKG